MNFELSHVIAKAIVSAKYSDLKADMIAFCAKYNCTMECVHNSVRIIADKDHTITIPKEK